MPTLKKRKNEDALHTWLLMLISLSGLFWSTALAINGSFFTGEQGLFEWFYDSSANVVGLMLFVTNAGTVLLLIATLAVLDKYKRYLLTLRTIVSVILTVGFVLVAKNIVDRARPDGVIDITQRELFIIGSQGFPSGHVALATAIVATVLPFIPKLYRLPVLLIPVLVAVSRINLGAHLPLDVLGGAFIGILVATMVRLATTSERFVRSHNRIASRIKKA